MAFKTNSYYYDAQIRSYVLQFMAIFTDMQVQIGKWASGNTVTEPAPTCDDPNATVQVEEIKDERLISVPIHYGHQDRIVAAIFADNVQTKPIRLPVMSVMVKNFKLAPDRFHGLSAERRNVYTPVGGLIPDDTKVVHQRMPVPYDLDIELAIYTSNTDQHFQILEQIFLLFDPKINIQSDDGPFNWTRLTQVTLTDVNFNANYPIGTDRRITQTELGFTMPIWISAPADVRKDFIEKIFMRIGAVSAGAVTNFDILAELDGQGILYDVVGSTDDLPFK